jgi:nitrile hydratase
MPRFRDGDRVRILDLGKPGHVRIPVYTRLAAGIVERWCGAFPNPEDLAQAKPGLPPVDLFRVRLRQADLWHDYGGAPGDTLDIEVYDHWLEAAGDDAS